MKVSVKLVEIELTSEDATGAISVILGEVFGLTPKLPPTVSQETPLPVPQIVGVTDLPDIELPEPAKKRTAQRSAKPVTKRTRRQLAFDEFDDLVRSEMQRLAVDGRMPSGPQWDAAKDARLPSMTSVIGRYQRRHEHIVSMGDLAKHLGLLPALTGAAGYKARAVSEMQTNGHQPRSQEGL